MPVLDATLNLIVAAFAPARVEFSAEQFADFAAMKSDFNARGVLTVNVNHSENTIFGGPVTNWQFRAWHDAAHLATDSDFSITGERAAAAYQIAQVFTVYGFNRASARWAALIDCEVNGQAAHFYRTGEFVKDQFAFTVAQLRDVYQIDVDAFPLHADASTLARDYRAATLAAMPAPVCDPYGHIVPPAHLLEFAALYCDCIHTVRTAQATARRLCKRAAYRVAIA